MIPPIELGAVIAPIISAIGVTILYHYIGRDYLGADENEQWNSFRRSLLSGFDEFVRGNSSFALTNPARSGEFVGTVEMNTQEFAQLLEGAGYVQGVLSGLKNRGEDETQQYESGSMVFRESKSDLIPDSLAVYQNHVFWFENGDGSVDVYSHYEYSSANPLVAWPHYRAVGQDFDEGVSRTKAVLRSTGTNV